LEFWKLSFAVCFVGVLGGGCDKHVILRDNTNNSDRRLCKRLAIGAVEQIDL
jgi:hypothetical protein